MTTTNDLFTAVRWPEVQEYFDIPSFKENSVLINDDFLCRKYGHSAYLIKTTWLAENKS
ncbi:MAG: hypothetical protein ACTSPO_15485 [Candidatus Heimdallarchaeaceae archaeon]